MRLLVFSGLSHHLGRLKPLLDRATALGDEVVLAAADNPWGPLSADFEAIARRDRFTVRMLSEWAALPSVRARLARERQASAAIWRETLSAGVAPQSFLVGHRLAYSLDESLAVGAQAQALLSDLAPDAVLVLHQRNFWTRLVSAEAERAGIPLVTFQEGLFYDIYEPACFEELAALGDRVLLWGEDDVSRLAAVGHDRSRMRAIGAMHLEGVLQEIAEVPRSERRAALGLPIAAKVVMVVPPTSAIGGLGAAEFEALISWAEPRNDVHVVIKWRPLSEEQRAAERWRTRLGPRLHSHSDTDPCRLAAAADLVVGHSTSLLAEAIAVGTDVVELCFARGSRSILNIAEAAQLPRLTQPEDFEALDDWLEHGLPAPARAGAARYRSARFAQHAQAPSALAYAEISGLVSDRARQPGLRNGNAREQEVSL